MPFSDPVADGPTIQAADVRALAAGTPSPTPGASSAPDPRTSSPSCPSACWSTPTWWKARGRPILRRRCRAAGVDSVLIADVPTLEAAPYARRPQSSGILPVLIATPTADDEQLAAIAELTRGYTYVVTRAGVTGVDDQAQVDQQ